MLKNAYSAVLKRTVDRTTHARPHPRTPPAPRLAPPAPRRPPAAATLARLVCTAPSTRVPTRVLGLADDFERPDSPPARAGALVQRWKQHDGGAQSPAVLFAEEPPLGIASLFGAAAQTAAAARARPQLSMHAHRRCALS